MKPIQINDRGKMTWIYAFVCPACKGVRQISTDRLLTLDDQRKLKSESKDTCPLCYVKQKIGGNNESK